MNWTDTRAKAGRAKSKARNGQVRIDREGDKVQIAIRPEKEGAWEGNGREIRIATRRKGIKQRLALRVKGEAAI
jgi:hypothetical protein